MENPQQTVPMTELAESVFQLHIQNASLMQQLKKANEQLQMQATLLNKTAKVGEEEIKDIKLSPEVIKSGDSK